MKKLVAVVAMSGAMMFGLASPAIAGPASAPNVVGLSEVQAISVLESQGIKVRVASRNGSGPRPESCVVRHQQDLSGKTRTKVTWGTNDQGRRVVVSRETIVTPPSTTLNVVC